MTQISAHDLVLYKRGIWFYLILLIFEGALRKWIFPELSNFLLLIREPIVIWLVCVGLYKRWLQNGYVVSIMIISTLSLLFSLGFGHGNLLIGLYGWRIYFFHIPFLFVIARLLNREDVLQMGKFFLYVSIPMTFLIVLQFYSPQSAWINQGIAGEGSAGFGGALGYYRPSGTFSFISGYVGFQGVVGCLLCFYLFKNKTLENKFKLPYCILYSALGAYIVSIPTSISRTHFFQTLVFIAFAVITAVLKKKYKSQFLKFVIIGIIVFVIVSAMGLMNESMQAFSSRFEDANTAEGGVQGVIGNRYIGGLINSLINFDIPFGGYGIGIGTSAGSSLMEANMFTLFNGEIEWSRIIGECGMLLGWGIILIRCLLSLKLFKIALMRMRKVDLLPWFLSANMLLTLPQGQVGPPTNLGFCVFTAGIVLAAMKIPRKMKNKQNYSNKRQLS